MQRAAFKVAVFLQRHSILFILLLIALIAGAVPGVTSITIDTGWDTFIEADSQVYRDYEKYKSKGIEFVRDPKKVEYGTFAVFKDLYGNQWDLLEPNENNKSWSSVP